MVVPSRNVFAVLSHGSSRVARLILTFTCTPLPMVPFLVRSYQTVPMIMVSFPASKEHSDRVALSSTLLFVSSYQKLFAVRPHKNQVGEDAQRGMVLCAISQEDRALTLCICSNLGMGFKATLLPSMVMRMA